MYVKFTLDNFHLQNPSLISDAVIAQDISKHRNVAYRCTVAEVFWAWKKLPSYWEKHSIPDEELQTVVRHFACNKYYQRIIY